MQSKRKIDFYVLLINTPLIYHMIHVCGGLAKSKHILAGKTDRSSYWGGDHLILLIVCILSGGGERKKLLYPKDVLYRPSCINTIPVFKTQLLSMKRRGGGSSINRDIMSAHSPIPRCSLKVVYIIWWYLWLSCWIKEQTHH